MGRVRTFVFWVAFILRYRGRGDPCGPLTGLASAPPDPTRKAVFVEAALARGDSYGYELITALVDKLEGELSVNGQAGTQVNILLKDYKVAA